MQDSDLHGVLTATASTPSSASTKLLSHDLGAPPSDAFRSAGALMTPVAMLVGAVGLMTLWMAAPQRTTGLSQALPSLAAVAPSSAHQIDAVQAAVLRQDRVLTRLLVDLGAPVRLASPPAVNLTSTAAQTVASLREAEAGMVSAADLEARARLKTMQTTFRSTGLDVRPYMTAGRTTALSPLELRDVHVLAARLDVDASLARQVQHTARDLIAAQALGEAATSLPLATPVDIPVRSSPFGERTDPFTHEQAFHPGQDFAGRYGDAIRVTAAGIVSFVGQRSGYGNCVEVDHGHGFKTRYGHLSGFTLGVGSNVATGDVVGRMGSTGRSTGVHLHYEVWASGRLLNPVPFLDAGQAQKARSA